MIAISVNNLSFGIGTTPILEDVSFALEETDKLGIIGVNGCGKSTLFRLILGEETPTSGEVYFSRGKSVGILTQDGAFEARAGQSVLEQMYYAFPELLRAEARLAELEPLLSRGDAGVIREYTDLHDRFVRDGGLEFRGRCASILQKLGFDERAAAQDVATLSGGQRTRLALAVQLSREPDILMLDEPTNHLDIGTLGWLETFLSTYRKCVMVISHDRYFLDRVTNKTLAIERHRAKLYNGGYTRSMEQRRIDREIAEKHWKNQQKEIARQEAYIAQQRAWNRERNIIAAESRQKMLDKMERLERPQDAPKGISMRFSEAMASGNDVLEVRGLSMAFPGKPLFSGLNFLIKRGDRALVVGGNGCGKSTLLKLILGQLSPVSGSVTPGYNVEIGYYDQENQNLTPENTVLDELWNTYPTLPEAKIRGTLGLFRFTGEEVFKPVSVLSGGERARLTLSKLMLSKINVLILDEPTNHLDMDSREALEEALAQFDGTVLAVSHDRYFVEKLATRILELKPGAPFDGDLLDFTVTHPGNGFTELTEYRAARTAEHTAPDHPSASDTGDAALSAGKEQYLRGKQAASDARKKKTRLEKLQKECEDLEREIAQIEEELFGSAASDYLRAAELDQRKSEAEDRLLAIYEEQEELGQ